MIDVAAKEIPTPEASVLTPTEVNDTQVRSSSRKRTRENVMKGTWKRMMTIMTNSMGEWMLDMINNVSAEDPDHHGGGEKPVEDQDVGGDRLN